MKGKLLALTLGMAISLQSMCFTVNAEADTDSIGGIRTITIDNSNDNITEIELYEGEQIQLDFQLDPETYDLEDIRSYEENQSPIVSYDGKLVGCSNGKYRIDFFVRNKATYRKEKFILDVNVLPNENISAENRAELDRINKIPYNDYRRRKMELLGVIDEKSPRMTIDKIQEIIDSTDDYYEIIKKVNKYVGYPDEVFIAGTFSYTYWFDPMGNESISIGYEDIEYVIYTKTADDGTVIGSQMLYPDKTEFYENGKDKNYDYIQYNQIKPEGNGTLNLKFIDESTGEPFTDTNGKFQLISGADDKIIKSWDASEGSEITISDLPPDCTYELRYVDDYHGDELFDLQYRYYIEYGTNRFSFAYDNEISEKVYLKKRYRGDPYLIGDVNGDNLFNIADVVTLQKWLLGKPNAVLMDWESADLCRDGVLNSADLCIMKKNLYLL